MVVSLRRVCIFFVSDAFCSQHISKSEESKLNSWFDSEDDSFLPVSFTIQATIHKVCIDLIWNTHSCLVVKSYEKLQNYDKRCPEKSNTDSRRVQKPPILKKSEFQLICTATKRRPYPRKIFYLHSTLVETTISS